MQLDTEDYIIIWLLIFGLVLTVIGAYVMFRLHRQSLSERELEVNKQN